MSGNLLRLRRILDEIDLQAAPQKLGHGLLNEAVGDGFFGLVLVAGGGGEVVGDQDQAVLHVAEGDLALIFIVFALLFQIAV